MFFTLRRCYCGAHPPAASRTCCGRCLVCASRHACPVFCESRRAPLRERRRQLSYKAEAGRSDSHSHCAAFLKFTTRRDRDAGAATRTTGAVFPEDGLEMRTTRSRNRAARATSKSFRLRSSLLKLRHEHVALRTGQLWHLASRILLCFCARIRGGRAYCRRFNNADQPRELRIPLADTPRKGGSHRISLRRAKAEWLETKSD